MTQRIYLNVRDRWPDWPPIPVPTDEDEMLDFEDIGGIYNDASSAAKTNNDQKLAEWLSRRNQLPAVLAFAGPQTVPENKRQPGIAHFAAPINITVGGASGVSDLILSGRSTIQNDQLTGNGAIGTIKRTAGTSPLIEIDRLKFVSSGSGLVFDSAGHQTFCRNCTFEVSGTGTLDQDGWSDMDDAPFAVKVLNTDGLQMTGMGCAVCNGHGIIAKRWNAGICHANVRNAAGVGMKAQQLTDVALRGRFESNFGYGVLWRDCGTNRYEAGEFQAQDGAPSAMSAWLENNGARGSIHAPVSGGYWAVQGKFHNCAALTVGGHTGWASNMLDMDEGTRNSCKFIEALHINQSRAPSLELVTNNTVASIDLPQDNWGDATVTTIDQVWSSVGDRPTAQKFGTPGTDEVVRITYPAGALENVSNPTETGYWRPFGKQPLSIVGGETLIYEIEWRDISGAAAWCHARRTATQMQTPRLGAVSVQPMGAGRNYLPVWNSQKRKTTGRIKIMDARADVSVGIDVFFEGMEQRTDGHGQPDAITIEISQLRLYLINDN